MHSVHVTQTGNNNITLAQTWPWSTTRIIFWFVQPLHYYTLFFAGDTEGNKKVCSCILNKIIEDPLSASCPNLSYADVNGPVANFNPTGSPYALAPNNCCKFDIVTSTINTS